mgnify:FL=1
MLQSKRRSIKTTRPAKTRPVKKNRPVASASMGTADYEALARFRYQIRQFLTFSEEAAHQSGLTSPQHQAMLAIKGFSKQGAVTVGKLAEFLLIKHHTAVELTDRMTKLGLLSREVDQDDGRRVLLKLTREGEQRLQPLSKVHRDELRSASAPSARILKSFRAISQGALFWGWCHLILSDLV